MNKLVPLLLLACLAGAQSAELAGVLDDYFSASEAGDADAFIATIVIPDGDDGFTRAAVAALFDGFSQEDLEWSFIEEKFYESDYAHLLFDLKGTLVDKETGDSFEVEEPYIAVFEKHGSEWLIWKLMPLNEFAYYAANHQDFITEASEQQVTAIQSGGSGGGGDGGDEIEFDLMVLLGGLLDGVDFGGLVESFVGWFEETDDPHAGYDVEYNDSGPGDGLEVLELDLVDSIIGFFVIIAMIYGLLSLFKK